jgi:hypothetical protein
MILRILKHPFLAIAFTTLIFILCVLPSENIPNGVDDKAAHLLAFVGISFLWLWVKPNYLLIIISSILFGFTIEIIQGLLPINFHRSFDINDGLADALGVLMGAFFSFIMQRIIKKLA